MKKGHGSILKKFFLFSSMKSWTKRNEWNFQWMGGRETPKQEKLGTGLSRASSSKARVWVAHIQKRVVLLNFFGRRSTDRWGKMLGVAILDLVVEAQWWLHSSPNGSTHERRYQSIQLKQPGLNRPAGSGREESSSVEEVAQTWTASLEFDSRAKRSLPKTWPVRKAA